MCFKSNNFVLFFKSKIIKSYSNNLKNNKINGSNPFKTHSPKGSKSINPIISVHGQCLLNVITHNRTGWPTTKVYATHFCGSVKLKENFLYPGWLAGWRFSTNLAQNPLQQAASGRGRRTCLFRNNSTKKYENPPPIGLREGSTTKFSQHFLTNVRMKDGGYFPLPPSRLGFSAIFPSPLCSSKISHPHNMSRYETAKIIINCYFLEEDAFTATSRKVFTPSFWKRNRRPLSGRFPRVPQIFHQPPHENE